MKPYRKKLTKVNKMANNQSFDPKYGSGIPVFPDVVSASVTVGAGNKSLNLTNLSATVVVYVRVGTAPVTATTADMPILPNQRVVISKAHESDTVAYISSAPGSLHIIPGEGYA